MATFVPCERDQAFLLPPDMKGSSRAFRNQAHGREGADSGGPDGLHPRHLNPLRR